MGRALEVTTAAAGALLESIVDYAGLFPPAALSVEETVAEYARWRRSPEGWMLGRLVVPAGRLAELGGPAEDALAAGPGWRLSALVGEDVKADAARIAAFDREQEGRACVDTVELKAGTPAQVRTALEALPEALLPYVELPAGGDLGPLLAVLRSRGARAKIRAGGVTPEAIPEPADVARFVGACASAGVGFKATAGLHHAIRGSHPLTYATDAPRALMHGFLNVFAAAALAQSGAFVDLEAVLREENPSAFRLDDEGLAWRQLRVSTADLAGCRATFAASFGSCSFAEPVAELRALGVIG